MPDTDHRLMLEIGADTSEAERNMKNLLDSMNNLSEKSKTVVSNFDDLGKNKNTFQIVTNSVEKLENGFTRLSKTIQKVKHDSSGTQIIDEKVFESLNSNFTKQELALENAIKKYRTLTTEQRNSKAALEDYIRSLSKVIYTPGHTDSAAAEKAKYLADTELNRAANQAYKEITNLQGKRLLLEKQIAETGGHYKGILTQQSTEIDKQIAAKQQIVDFAGRQRIAEDLINKRQEQNKKLQAERFVISTKSNQMVATSVQLTKTQYGHVAEVLNAEGRVLKVLQDQYNARMRNSIAAQQLSKSLDTDTAKHINNGTAMGKFMNSAIYSASGMAQYAMFNTVTEGLQAIKDYETGIVDLRRTIQGVTEKELVEFGETAIAYAKDFGIEIKEVQDAMTELARAGVDDAETLKKMTEVVAIGLNTTEIETAEEMTGYLVSTVKQLNMDMNDSMEIIDTWNYLADQYAVHTDDFALAIQRAGSASKNLGLDLYDVNALVTILGEATQASGQNIGTALRSMEVRLLRPDTVKTLESYGIAVKKNENEFLSFQEIMSNVNEVIKDMEENSIDLNNIMDALGGSWRKNWVTTLANDWERFDELVAEQQNNIGYSIAENEKAMDTLEKKMTQAHQAWLEFVITSANESGLTEHLKTLFDGVTGIAEILTDSDIGKWVVTFAEGAAIITSIKLTLTGINKILGFDLPNSASELFKIISDNKNIPFVDAISNKTDRDTVGRNLLETFTSAKDASGTDKYSLEEQLAISQQIDKQFQTNTASIIKQKLEIQNTTSAMQELAKTIAYEKANVAPQDPKAMAVYTAHVKEYSQLEQQLVRQKAELNNAIALENASMERGKEVRAAINLQNARLIASQIALNTAITLGVAVIGTALLSAYDAVVNKQKNMIEAADTATEAYSNMLEKHQNSIDTISGLKDRYEELAVGVNKNGENVSLTADEYEEYLSIIGQIKDVTPELIGGYTAENQVLEDKNNLIEESIALLKEQERLEKINMLTEDGNERIKGAMAKAESLNTRYFNDAEIIHAANKGVISVDEKDTLFKYRESGEGSVEDINAIYDKLQKNAGEIRDSVKAAQNEGYSVLQDWASTVEGYEDLTSNQKEFINSLAENMDTDKLINNTQDAIDDILSITNKVKYNDESALLIDQIINADKTEMRLNEYEDYVGSRIKQLYETLSLEDAGYSVDDLKEVLDVNDELENVELLNRELSKTLQIDKERYDLILANNDVDSLYSLYEILDKFEDFNALYDLENIIGDVTDETGKLNTHLLKTVASLDKADDIPVFKDILTQLKGIDGVNFDKFGDTVMTMAADFTEALSFEDLDPSNFESYVEGLEDTLGNFFDKQYERIDSEIDLLYELGAAYNDWTQKTADIKNMDKASREYYDTMLELAKEYPHLVVGIDEATGAFKLQDGAMKTIEEDMGIAIEDQRAFIQTILSAALAIADYAETSLIDIKNVLTGVNSTGEGIRTFAQSVLNSLGDMIDNTTGILGVLIDGAKNWFYDAAKNMETLEFIKEEDKEEVIAALDSAIELVKGTKTTLGAYQVVSNNYTPYRGSYSSGSDSNGRSGSNSRSNSEDEYTAKADEYHKYTQKLGDIQQALEENAILEDLMTDSIEDQIKLLSERNGLLEMESKATQELLNAKKKKLNDTVWELNQLGYDVDWDKDANTILINNYKKLESVTGDAAKKQEEMLELVVELNNEVREYSNAIDENTASIYRNNYAIQEQKWQEEIDRQIAAYEAQEKVLENYQDSLETLLDLSVEMLKKEYEAEKESIENTTEAYKELLEAKKEALSDEADEEDYATELAKKQKEVADLQNKIKEISNDDSVEARAQKLTLQEELATAEEELYKFQRDHNLEIAQDALDKEMESFEQLQDDKLDEIDDYLEREGALREEAMKQISSNNRDFYNRLVEYNRVYGDGITSTVTNAWEDASKAVNEFGVNSMNTLQILTDIANEMERVSAAADALGNAKFEYNPEDTYGTTNATNNAGAGLSERGKQQKNQQKYLHNLMVEALAENKTGLIAWIKANRKEWGLDPDTGAIIEQFHTGGFVGDKVLLKSNEQFAKLLEGELVVTPQQMDNFINQIWPNIMERAGGYQLTIDNLINVEGNVDKTTIPAIQSASDGAIERLNEFMIKSGYSRNAKKTVV